MHKRFKELPGFTLVELVFVISIIGILCALAVFGYQGYIKSTRNAQIASAVGAYQNAVSATKNERQLVPDSYSENFGWTFTCLSTTNDSTPCCFLYRVDESNATPSYGCGNNTFHGSGASRWGGTTLTPGFPTGYSSSQLSTWVKQHLPSTLPPELVSTPTTACPSAITLWGGGLYCTTKEIGLEIRIEQDHSTTLFLHYMVPVDYDCQSKDVVTATDSPPGLRGTTYGQNIYYPYGVSYTNAKYTFRHATGGGGIQPFTFCVVGIN